MARRLFKRYLPDRQKVHSDRTLAWLRPIMNKPYLWHLNRHCVCRGLAMGMFWAWIPLPMQSIPALIGTVPMRGNIAVAYATTWLSNPFTLIPHWWLAYTIGKTILGMKSADLEFTWEFWKDKWDRPSWLTAHFWEFYGPMLLGSLVISTVAAGLSYVAVNFLWRQYTRYRWGKRQAARLPGAA